MGVWGLCPQRGPGAEPPGHQRDRMGNQDCWHRTYSSLAAQAIIYKLQFNSLAFITINLSILGVAYPTTWSLLTVDDMSTPTRLHEQYALVNSKVLVTRTVQQSREQSDNSHNFQDDLTFRRCAVEHCSHSVHPQ